MPAERRRYDWPAIRAAYVEGHASDPDGDPNARSWPTLDELAMTYGMGTATIRRHSAEDGWAEAREAFQRDVDARRRKAIAEQAAGKAASIDRRGLVAADGLLALVEARVEALVRVEVEARRTNPQAVGVAVNAPELTALGLAARRAVQVKDAVIGRKVLDGDDEALTEQDLARGERLLADAIRAHREAREADTGVDV